MHVYICQCHWNQIILYCYSCLYFDQLRIYIIAIRWLLVSKTTLYRTVHYSISMLYLKSAQNSLMWFFSANMDDMTWKYIKPHRNMVRCTHNKPQKSVCHHYTAGLAIFRTKFLRFQLLFYTVLSNQNFEFYMNYSA